MPGGPGISVDLMVQSCTQGGAALQLSLQVRQTPAATGCRCRPGGPSGASTACTTFTGSFATCPLATAFGTTGKQQHEEFWKDAFRQPCAASKHRWPSFVWHPPEWERLLLQQQLQLRLEMMPSLKRQPSGFSISFRCRTPSFSTSRCPTTSASCAKWLCMSCIRQGTPLRVSVVHSLKPSKGLD